MCPMVSFLAVELTHPGLNSRFNMCVTCLWLIIFLVVGDVSVDSKTLLMIDFVKLKIKSTQFFKCAHRNRMCIRVFIRECSYV
jgi:hypothetical protein